MHTLTEAFERGSQIPGYLEVVASIHRDALGEALIGLYLHGSMVQGDFRPGLSDLDILGVVSGKIATAQRERLVARLNHDTLPVPAFGLELILCEAGAVRSPLVEMPYELALSTGRDWGVQVEADGTTSDILIHMQLCRQAGVALAGAPGNEVLAPIPTGALRAALMAEMLWHRRDLCADPTDQAISNAVLNAARSLYAAEIGQVISKTEGGKWWLGLYPEEQVVVQALAFREGRERSAPDVRSARNFVEIAIATL